MQTFLPYSNYAKSAWALDNRRLGKQRVEALQILRMLLGETDGGSWRKHPAVRMWEGAEGALAFYGQAMLDEWIRRGFRVEKMPPKMFEGYVCNYNLYPAAAPGWLCRRDFHEAMQSNLIRKDPEHYRPLFGDDVPDDLPYVWPV